MSYIEREPLIKILNGLYNHHLTMRNYAADGATFDCISAVIEAPTADVVEVRHGHWIDKSRNINGLHDPRFDCSVCGHIFWFQGAETFNYCPACGAKMDGERSENGKS